MCVIANSRWRHLLKWKEALNREHKHTAITQNSLHMHLSAGKRHWVLKYLTRKSAYFYFNLFLIFVAVIKVLSSQTDFFSYKLNTKIFELWLAWWEYMTDTCNQFMTMKIICTSLTCYFCWYVTSNWTYLQFSFKNVKILISYISIKIISWILLN